ncbi:MAG: hypothetical protein ABH837_03605 [bacterium]
MNNNIEKKAKHIISPFLTYTAIILIIAVGIIICINISTGTWNQGEDSETTSPSATSSQKTDLEQIDDLIDSVNKDDFSQDLLSDEILDI